jgi:hypothetical protein
MFELVFCFISPSAKPGPGDAGKPAALNRLLGGDGTILGRSCGIFAVLPFCAAEPLLSASELEELSLELPPTLNEGLLWLGRL